MISAGQGVGLIMGGRLGTRSKVLEMTSSPRENVRPCVSGEGCVWRVPAEGLLVI